MRGHTIRWLLPLALVAATGAGVALAAPTGMHARGTVTAAKSSRYGTVLTSSNGRTLYRFLRDHKGRSACTGACSRFWPPLVVKGSARPIAGSGVRASMLGTVKRAGGVRQVTYGGYPLYTYAGDRKAGEANGEGANTFGARWYVVDAKGALVKHAVTSSSGTTTSGGSTSTGGGYGYGAG